MRSEQKHYSEFSLTSCYKLCIFTINTFSITTAMLKVSEKKQKACPYHFCFSAEEIKRVSSHAKNNKQR